MPYRTPLPPTVDAFLAELAQIPWFTRTGEALAGRDDVEQVDFHFLVRCREAPYEHWGPSLVAAETEIQRLIRDHALLDQEQAIHRAAKCFQGAPSGVADDFFMGLDDDYTDAESGYYGDTFSHPHELLDPPHRLVRGRALELLVAAHGYEGSFFREPFEWLREGHWPCGFRGGRSLVW